MKRKKCSPFAQFLWTHPSFPPSFSFYHFPSTSICFKPTVTDILFLQYLDSGYKMVNMKEFSTEMGKHLHPQDILELKYLLKDMVSGIFYIYMY